MSTDPDATRVMPVAALAVLEAREISAWFGDHQVLDGVTLTMPAGQVTALIGPSGCGKSTFLRILNRMHELVPSATLAGEIVLDGVDVYDRTQQLTEVRRQIGMVFQKPNPFPAMSIYDNVVAGLKLTGARRNRAAKDDLVREVTIVIVTHNMQQAQRVSQQCAFFLAEQGQPGYIVEHGPTEAMFSSPQDPRTADYVNGRFG